jgi:histidine triad (HIT) family protein
MSRDPDCIFCKIVAGELPARKVDEDENTIAFLDIAPWTRGHTLVIPREHTRNLYEASEEVLHDTGVAAQRVAKKMRDRLGAEGINLLNSTEPVAMQTVFHYHVHVIPRYEDDGFGLPGHKDEASEEELDEVEGELRG